MEIEQVAELARKVAALTKAERDFFDGMVADELAAAADAERVANLRGMSDVDAVQSAIAWASETVDLDAIPGRMLQGLVDAGFARNQSNTDISDAVLDTIDRVLRVIIALDRQGGPYPHEIPTLRNDLYFALDRLTGEDHSGNSPSLPPPPRRLVGRDAIRALREELAKGVPTPTWAVC